MLLNDNQILGLCVPKKSIYKIPKIDAVWGGPECTMIDWKYRLEDCYMKNPMISPFLEHQVSEVDGQKVISYGLSACGYDIRLADTVLAIDTYENRCTDIDIFDYDTLMAEKLTVCHENGRKFVVLKPRQYVLGCSIETFNMLPNIAGRCFGKSSLARIGVHVNVTPLEPSWCGSLTIEIGNCTDRHMRLYLGQGIAQVQFELVQTVATPYSARKNGGKYQDQPPNTPVTARV